MNLTYYYVDSTSRFCETKYFLVRMRNGVRTSTRDVDNASDATASRVRLPSSGRRAVARLKDLAEMAEA